MFIKNLSKRERNIAFATIAVFAAALFYNFIVDPVAKEWQSLNLQISSKTETLKKDLKMLSMEKELDSNYSKFSKYIRSAKNQDEEVADLLAYLESVSRSDSCLITNIKPIGVKEYAAYKEVLIDITAEADASRFSKFLYDIENSKNMILKVRRLTLTSTMGQAGILRGSFLIGKIIVE